MIYSCSQSAVTDLHFQHDLLPPAIRSVSGNFFTFQQESAPAHCVSETVALLSAETSDSIWCRNWTDGSQTVDYTMWGILQEWFYHYQVRDIDHLQEWLTDWSDLIIRAVNQWHDHWSAQKKDTLIIWVKQLGLFRLTLTVLENSLHSAVI